MNSAIRVLHVMNDFGRSQDQFLLRMATNPDRRISNAVLCIRSHCKPPAALHFIKTLAVPDRIRTILGRRISSRMGTLASSAVENEIVQTIRRRYAPHVIHVQDGRFAGEKHHLIRNLSAPILTTFHGGDINLATYDQKRYKQIQKAFSFSDRCHFVSTFLLQQAIKLGADPQKSKAVYLGTQVTELSRQRHSPKNVTFACVANMVACKGHEPLLHAFASLRRIRPSCRLLLIGNGPLRPRIDWLIKSLGIRDAVDCAGQVEWLQTQEILTSDVDILVHPGCRADDGSEEALGLVLCEAAERGLPIISTYTGGIPEAVQDGVSGLLVRERSPQQLTEAMLKLHDDESLRTTMGKHGRQNVERRFDANRQLSVFADMYCELGGSPTRQPSATSPPPSPDNQYRQVAT